LKQIVGVGQLDVAAHHGDLKSMWFWQGLKVPHDPGTVCSLTVLFQIRGTQINGIEFQWMDHGDLVCLKKSGHEVIWSVFECESRFFWILSYSEFSFESDCNLL
jgi:hypothetical protein